MVAQMMAIALVMAVAFAPTVAASGGHPIVKVIDLLDELSRKVVSEGQEEEVSFSKFQYWCSTSISEVEKAIEESKETIDSLKSSIEGYKAQKKELEDQIKELETEIKDMQDAATKAEKKDADRNKLYVETKKDLKTTIKSIGEAITALEGASSTDSKLLQLRAQTSVRQALALLSAKASDEQMDTLVSFAGGSTTDRPDQLSKGDLDTHVEKYKFKSDNVIDLLKGLKLKFEDDLTATETEETDAANSYALEKKARDAAEEASTKSKDQKTEMLGETKSSLSTAEADLKDSEADLKADEETLEKTQLSCTTKTEEWKERSTTRKNELEAIAMAKKILAKVAGVRTEAPKNPVLPSSPVDFIQAEDPKAQAVQLLRRTAALTHSKAMERLAMEVSTHLTGPFTKVNDMIQKMIYRLMAEQTDEDKHKAWCDVELTKSEKTKDDKKDKIKDLDAKITASNAKVGKITDDLTDVTKMIADITAFMGEATEIRNAGKEENKIAIKDAKQAQEAIAKAVAVLETHYKESGEVAKEPWEFIQEPVKLPKDPKLWDSSYTGVADPKKADVGVIAILEKMATDFSKMEAETKAQEVTDQKEYEGVMKTHAVEKKRRLQESEMKVQEKKRLIEKVTSLTGQKKHATDELEAVKAYLEDLQPACVDGDSTYADRKAARGKEIKALKDAKVLLEEAFKDKDGDSKKGAFLAVQRHGALA